MCGVYLDAKNKVQYLLSGNVSVMCQDMIHVQVNMVFLNSSNLKH